jgi:hypothetical protein
MGGKWFLSMGSPDSYTTVKSQPASMNESSRVNYVSKVPLKPLSTNMKKERVVETICVLI